MILVLIRMLVIFQKYFNLFIHLVFDILAANARYIHVSNLN